MSLSPEAVPALKQALRQIASGGLAPWPRFSLGLPALDEPLGGGLVRGALHEILPAAPDDLAAPHGFAIALALRAAGRRPILWVWHDRLDREIGMPYPPGLAAFGLDPGRLILVRTPDMAALLRTAAEAARCPALGAVLVAPFEGGRVLDLTASRRLSLAAQGAGVTLLLTRAPGPPVPSAAHSRWLAGPRPSQALAANAPGRPAFALALQRHRGGVGPREWCVEWNRDEACFENRGTGAAPLSRPVVAVPADGQAAA
jgi:protein ImuA